MRVVFYYSSTDAGLIEAKAMDNTDSAAVQMAGADFAALFGAKAMFTQGFAPRFAGIAFDKESPAKNWLIWTKPTQQNPCMVPLNPAHLRQGLQANAKYVSEVYRDKWPVEAAKARESHLLQALGVSEAATVGNALAYFFDKGGVSWIASTLPLRFTEIVASQYDAAQGQFELAQMLPNVLEAEIV